MPSRFSNEGSGIKHCGYTTIKEINKSDKMFHVVKHVQSLDIIGTYRIAKSDHNERTTIPPAPQGSYMDRKSNPQMQKGSKIIANVIPNSCCAILVNLRRRMKRQQKETWRCNFPLLRISNSTRKAFSYCRDCRSKTWTEFTSHLQFYNCNDFYRYLFHSFSLTTCTDWISSSTPKSHRTILWSYEDVFLFFWVQHQQESSQRTTTTAYKKQSSVSGVLFACLPFTSQSSDSSLLLLFASNICWTDQHGVSQLGKQLQTQNQYFLCYTSERYRRIPGCSCPVARILYT